MKNWIALAIVAVIAVILITSVIYNTPQKIDGTGFERIQNIEFIDKSGKIVILAELKGKPLVINSWAVWCPFCREELPAFATLQEEFKDSITVIVINRQESFEKQQRYIDELGVEDRLMFLLDENDEFYRNIGGFSMPETIFVNKDGDIVIHKRGPMDIKEMREHTMKIL